MRAFRDRDLDGSTLRHLLRAETASGILGLRLFIACAAVAAFMMGAVWMLGGGMSTAMERNARAILGGDAAITVVNHPLDQALVAELAATPGVAALSRVVELRSTARAGTERAPIELKAVDDAYPLLGAVGIAPEQPLDTLFEARDGVFGAAVEDTLLTRLPVAVGDRLAVGEVVLEIRAVLTVEPDRLSAGGFLVGPRVMIGRAALDESELLAPGALADFRYRLRFAEGAAGVLDAVSARAPEAGWELETPADAGDRARRVVERTTTFLGLAGIVALAIGLAGAWASATVWIGRRARTIALYRLSGATPALVIALHGVIVALAAVMGIALGIGAAAAMSLTAMDLIATRLHLPWEAMDLARPGLLAAATLAIGLAGSTVAALSAAANTRPGAAMRGGEVDLATRPRHAVMGLGGVALALALAVASLPYPALAAVASVGLVVAAGVLAAAGYGLTRFIAGRAPTGFVELLTVQGLSRSQAAAMKALTIGIGIAGVVAVLSAQTSLDRSLRAEIPDKAPDIVLIDVQRDQVDALTARIDADPALGGLQADPFMRMTLLRVNDVPVEDALVRPDKRWVIEGDRSFGWSDGATASELLAGSWWEEGYAGPPVVAPEEDIAEAFDLVPGDTLTYSVLGRPFTSEVVAIRKEYHRTFRPEQLLLASAEPFRNAPHGWIMTLQGDDAAAIDRFIADVPGIAPNVTAIDVRRIVAQVARVIDGASGASLAIAGVLLLAGALTLAAVMIADVDARRREALTYTLLGASRREIALARLCEFLALGAIAAVVGGAAGLLGGWWVTQAALNIPWTPGPGAFLALVALGLASAVGAGLAGGIGALPRGRGQVARHLAG
jgi:putative ABC transport system permease protein